MDLGFLRLYLNDFNAALQGDDSNDVSIEKHAYIQVSPCGVISQFTNCKDGVSFVGGITVELIDSCGKVLQDVSEFFYYDTYVLNGLPQIFFEFGKVGKDYYFKRLFLKITDNVNQNIYYSNSFINTDMDIELSTEFVYKENVRFKGIPYDLKSNYQRVRFYRCYYKDTANVINLKEYTQTDGRIMNYRNVTTFGKSFVFEKLDLAIDNRMNDMFSHSIVYANGERIKIQSYEPKEILGDSNFKTAIFKVNPQGEYFTLGYQVYEPLQLDSFTPSGRYNVDTFPNEAVGVFNRVITLGIGTIKIYDEFNQLIATFTQDDIIIDNNLFGFDLSDFDLVLKKYYIIISKGLFRANGCNDFSITNPTQQTFEIGGDNYNKPSYSTQYS